MTQSEGGNEKIIQATQNNDENPQDPENEKPADQQQQEDDHETHQSLKLSTSIPFPSADDSQPNLESNNEEQVEEQQYGRGQRVKHKKGHYKALNEGLVAAVTTLVDETQTNNIIESPKQVVEHVLEDANKYYDESYQLLPDIALTSFAYLDPKTLDEALRGPDAKQWQEALEYEIGQLEKLETWVVVDLPVGHTAIPLDRQEMAE